MWWPRLEEKVKKVMAPVQGPAKQRVRSERDILEEILARVRVVPPTSPRVSLHPGALEDLLETYRRLVLEVDHLPEDVRGDVLEIARRLGTPIEFLAGRTAEEGNIFPTTAERLEMAGRRFKFQEKLQSPTVSQETDQKRRPIKRASRNR